MSNFEHRQSEYHQQERDYHRKQQDTLTLGDRSRKPRFDNRDHREARPRPRPNFKPQNERVKAAEGHERVLQDAMSTTGHVFCVMRGFNGEGHQVLLHGRLLGYDKYSLIVEIPLDNGETAQMAVFKHDLSSFRKLSEKETEAYKERNQQRKLQAEAESN
jgi:hypothetical protein